MGKFLQSLLIAALVLLTVWTGAVKAQGGRGVLTGTVKDSGGSVLSSAQVVVQPLNRSAVTNDQGQFRISDLPAGEYELSVTYVGFAAFSQKVQVVAGQTVTVDPVLQVASQNDQVIVTAERVQGEAEAINIERLSENIVQVLPERVIQSLPNTNIADAVGRVPSVSLERDEGEGKYVQIRGTEPRLSNVTVNGVNLPSPETNVRNIKLDAIPADLVERIEVFKTLSANQDADGIGGTVNLVTRTAGERPTYIFGGTGGYNPIQKGYWRGGFGGTVGRRFGPERKLGLLLNGTYDKTNRGIDDLEPSQAIGTDPVTGRNVAYSNGEDQRSYVYYRTRYGFSNGIDYNLKPGSNLYFKGLFADFHDYGETRVYTPNAGTNIKSVSPDGKQITFMNAQDCVAVNKAADVKNPGANPCSPGLYQYRHYIRRPDQQVYSFLAGGRHDLSSTLITYEFAGSRAHNIGGQDFQTTNFNGPTPSYDNNGNLLPGPTGADLAVSLRDPLRPKFNAVDTSNIYDPTQYVLANTSFTRYSATQLNFQGAASMARRYSAHSHLGTFEIGIKVRNSHSTQNENDHIYNYNGSSITLGSVLGSYTNPIYYDNYFRIGSLSYGPTSNYASITRAVVPILGDPNLMSEDTARSLRRSNGAFFDANERIYAGYVQNVISFGKLRLQTGLRFDAANTGFTANQFTAQDAGNPTKIFRSSNYFNALPSVQAQYQLRSNTNLRANYSQGISRPNIGDLVPTTIVDPNTSPKTVTQGNPNLKPTKANNYDILIEHYFQPLGILQGGYFYKQLSNPIYQTASLLGPTDPNPGYRLLQTINGPSAHIQGIEVSWEQRFSFLPGLLNGFGVSANYSYTQSAVTFPSFFNPANAGGEGRLDHPALPRQAPNTWNVGFTYDKQRFSMRFAASHNDANIAFYNYSHTDAATDRDPILGLKGPSGDVYFYAHTQYDIQGSYRLGKGLRFEASGLNLSNEVFGFYQGSTVYPVQREFYKPTVSLGLRWSSSSE
ncbi:MAG TPA: TonB-dependent receptor [Candidatus Dormibacteraeota bacterium]|nr:TonB-dependent receptor [Candidatus Dormibacteraeota bacterium]